MDPCQLRSSGSELTPLAERLAVEQAATTEFQHHDAMANFTTGGHVSRSTTGFARADGAVDGSHCHGRIMPTKLRSDQQLATATKSDHDSALRIVGSCLIIWIR